MFLLILYVPVLQGIYHAGTSSWLDPEDSVLLKDTAQYLQWDSNLQPLKFKSNTLAQIWLHSSTDWFYEYTKK